MRPPAHRLLTLGSLAFLVACQQQAPVGVTASAKPGPRVTAKPTRTPDATPLPGGGLHEDPKTSPTGSSAPATAAPVPVGMLVAPPGATRALTGAVALDAGYALGTSLISDRGAGVLGPTGAVALVAAAGGNLISNHGGGIISDNGAGLISDAGGNLIANNGGGLVSQTKYGVLQAAAAARPAPGTMWPAAGMALRAIDLLTGASVPLGRDAAGTPAYEIVTDAVGGFKVFLPAEAAARIRLQAFPMAGDDARLKTSALLLDPAATSRDLDEDTAQVADYVRQVFFSATMVNFKRDPASIDAEPMMATVPADEYEETKAGWLRLLDAMRRARMAERPLAYQRLVAERISDIGLARVPLATVRFEDGDAGAPPAIEAMAAVLKKIRQAVAVTMTRELDLGNDPAAYFDGRDYLKKVNATADKPYRILKPADFNAFLSAAYLANAEAPSTQLLDMAAIFKSGDVKGLQDSDAMLMLAGSRAFFLAYTRALYLGSDKGVDPLIRLLDSLPPP